jgi:hypothetical protein
MHRRNALLLLSAALAMPQTAHAIEPTALQSAPRPRRRAHAERPARCVWRSTAPALAGLRAAPATRRDAAAPGRRTIELGLERFDVFAPGSSVHATEAGSFRALAYRPVMFRGGVSGEPGSMAVVVWGTGTRGPGHDRPRELRPASARWHRTPRDRGRAAGAAAGAFVRVSHETRHAARLGGGAAVAGRTDADRAGAVALSVTGPVPVPHGAGLRLRVRRELLRRQPHARDQLPGDETMPWCPPPTSGIWAQP